MKLIKLELLNLASLDRSEGEVIDFENGVLGNTSIFSIVGPMGSGKSTILDAICLALYNRAPRYRKKSSQNNRKHAVFGNADGEEANRLAPTDERNILTRGRKYGYSKLTFKANNGNLYRAEWSVQFKRKKFETAQTRLFQLYREDSDPGVSYREEVREWNTLPQIIGLDYEQFLRTVLIAQGSFAEFIKEDVDKRYRLLEKLVGSEEIYSAISCRIKDRKTEAEKKLAEVSAGVEAERRNVLPDPELVKLKADISELEEGEAKIAEELKLIDKELAWHSEDEQKLRQINIYAKDLQMALEEMDKIKDSSARLILHDALLPAVDILRERERLDKTLANDAGLIKEALRKIEDTKKEIEEQTAVETDLKKKSEAAVKEAAEARPHINEARRIRTLIEAAAHVLAGKEKALNDAKKEREEAEKALKENGDAIAKGSEKVKLAKEKLAMVNAEVEKKKNNLLMLEEKFSKALESEKSKVEGMDAEALQKQREQADSNFADLKLAIEISENIAKISVRLKDGAGRWEKLRMENTRLEREIAALRIDDLQTEVNALTQMETLMRSENWAEHRHMLSDGDECPLCGAKHHPYSENPEMFEISAAVISAALGEKKSLLEKERQSKISKDAAMAKNKGESEALETAAEKEIHELEDLENKWIRIKSEHVDWPRERDALMALRSGMEEESCRCRKNLENFMSVSKKIESLSKSLEDTIRAKAKYADEAAAMVAAKARTVADVETALAAEMALAPVVLRRMEEKSAALANAEKEMQLEKAGIEKLNVKFVSELNGKNPDEEETRLDKRVRSASEAVDAQTKKIAALQTALGERQGALEHLRRQNETNAGLRSARNMELDKWIVNYNQGKADCISVENVREILYSSEDWEAIRQEQQERKTALSKAEALHADALVKREEYQALKPWRSAEELEAARKRREAESRRNVLIEAKARLRNHNDSLERMGARAEVLREARQLRDDWAEISDSIGSDGKLLRQIAQCYTLRFLIEQSNNEIRKFNSRYELVQVKNSLGIRVIDHDRADDVRDTTSLSGGETFIVSLGLALGLSAISSRNVSFENLFIDEGFGSLDPETLSTVIDSLASLQSQHGKKVGVISHTDMMSERIMTQIRVVKNGNTGSSRIEIIG